MKEQRKPFIYRLERSGEDLLFKRVVYENVKDASEIENLGGCTWTLKIQYPARFSFLSMP